MPIVPHAPLARWHENEVAAALAGRLKQLGVPDGEAVLTSPILRRVTSAPDQSSGVVVPDSWVSFVLGGEHAALVTGTEDGAGLRLGEITIGDMADRCLEAAMLADEALKDDPIVYHPMLIECPSAGIVSLVLRPTSHPSRRIDVVRGRLLRSHELAVRDDTEGLTGAPPAPSPQSSTIPAKGGATSMRDTRVIFGGLIAVVLLGLYAFALIEAIVLALSEQSAVLGSGFSHTLSTLGGLVSALVVTELAVTVPGKAPGGRWLSTVNGDPAAADGQTARTARTVGYMYVGTWLLLGVSAYVVGAMLHPEKVKPLTDFGQAWLGIAVAAVYAYFGVTPSK